MYSYKDIQWVRNVKRKGGEDWAYFDGDDKSMYLHWSSSYVKQPTHAMIPQIGDLVVLFQKVNTDNKIFFTHLLTPMDSLEHDFIKTNPKHRWGRKMKILARTKDIIKPKDFNLTAVNQGHTYSIELLNNNLSKEDIQKILWNVFAPFFKEDAKNFFTEILDLNLPKGLFSAIEGTESEKVRTHILRERNSALVAEKKRLAKIDNVLHCECCNFDFSQTYPNIGEGFIECHHKIPINKGERITNILDLALVCSNCHRMLHRKNKENKYYTSEELKLLINN